MAEIPAPPRYRGFWDSPPVSLAAYAHVLGEVLLPVAPRVASPLSAVAMGYFVLAAINRGGKASSLEPVTELQRFSASRAAIDFGLSGWLSCITLPSLALGAAVGPLASVLQANASRWRLSPAVTRFAPVAVGAALLPAVLPLSATAAEAVMAWAVRPCLDLAKPAVRGPRADYEAPSPAALLTGGADTLPGLALDDGDARRLWWALDGDPQSTFPDDALTAAARRGRPPPAAEEDAAFVAALGAYAARHRGGGGGGGGPAGARAPPPSSDEDSDYDRALAAALEAASSRRRRGTPASVAPVATAADAVGAPPPPPSAMTTR